MELQLKVRGVRGLRGVRSLLKKAKLSRAKLAKLLIARVPVSTNLHAYCIGAQNQNPYRRSRFNGEVRTLPGEKSFTRFFSKNRGSRAEPSVAARRPRNSLSKKRPIIQQNRTFHFSGQSSELSGHKRQRRFIFTLHYFFDKLNQSQAPSLQLDAVFLLP